MASSPAAGDVTDDVNEANRGRGSAAGHVDWPEGAVDIDAPDDLPRPESF